MSGCLSVGLCPIIVKTAEPIGPKFCVGPYMTLGKVCEWSKFQKLASSEIRFSLKLIDFFLNPLTFCLFLFYKQCTQRENVHNWNRRLVSLYTLLVYLSFFLSNKRQSSLTVRDKILCGTLHDPWEGLWMIKIKKIDLQ